MTKRRLLLTCAVAAVTVIASAIAADLSPSKPDEASRQLESLLKERRDTFRKLVEFVEVKHGRGEVDLPALIRVSNQLLDAELDLAKTKAERITLLQKLVANLRRVEEDAESRHNVGFGLNSFEALSEAKAARLKAEIQLVREQSSDK
jgi:hypothetical protein